MPEMGDHDPETGDHFEPKWLITINRNGRSRWTETRIEIAGIAPQPDGEWMKQMARNLTDVDDGFLRGTRYFIHDRDPLITQRFRGILKSSGVKTVRLPARSPDLNAYAERFVLSVKSECLTKIIPLGERHLRKAVK